MNAARCSIIRPEHLSRTRACCCILHSSRSCISISMRRSLSFSLRLRISFSLASMRSCSSFNLFSIDTSSSMRGREGLESEFRTHRAGIRMNSGSCVFALYLRCFAIVPPSNWACGKWRDKYHSPGFVTVLADVTALSSVSLYFFSGLLWLANRTLFLLFGCMSRNWRGREGCREWWGSVVARMCCVWLPQGHVFGTIKHTHAHTSATFGWSGTHSGVDWQWWCNVSTFVSSVNLKLTLFTVTFRWSLRLSN